MRTESHIDSKTYAPLKEYLVKLVNTLNQTSEDEHQITKATKFHISHSHVIETYPLDTNGNKFVIKYDISLLNLIYKKVLGQNRNLDECKISELIIQSKNYMGFCYDADDFFLINAKLQNYKDEFKININHNTHIHYFFEKNIKLNQTLNIEDDIQKKITNLQEITSYIDKCLNIL